MSAAERAWWDSTDDGEDYHYDDAPPHTDDDVPPELIPAPRSVSSVPPSMLQAVEAEMGVSGLDAVEMAGRLDSEVRRQQVTSLARRLVRNAEVERDADLSAIEVLTGAQIFDQVRPLRRQVLGDLVLEGHNVLLTARYKAGKSTIAENMAAAAVKAIPFLGRFEVAEPLRVAYLNYELDPDDMDERVRRLRLSADEIERLRVINLRGHRLPILGPTGRDWLVRQLADHGADVAFVDVFGAAYGAAGGISENDNAEVRRFTSALDEIKRLAGCRTLVMPAHTGRAEQEEGAERARGATVLDDWADVRMILTKDKGGTRFLRTEGRAVDLPESRLTFTDGVLTLDGYGVNRSAARTEAHAAVVVDAVKAQPGLKSTDLRAALKLAGITNTGEQASAMRAAIDTGAVHRHKAEKGNGEHHYAGPSHADYEPCRGGWRR